MKRKLLSLTLAAVMALSLFAGCASKNDAGSNTTGGAETAEIALITDVGTIDDKSFNQGSWEGVQKYAEEFGISSKYYKPAEKSDEAVLNAIDLAVKGGAKIVVCPGFLFEVPLHQAQSKYPDVKFVILDGAPHAGDYVPDIAENVLSIFFAEEQAGYLAGYAAVTEGYKKLGFMGGIAVPAVTRFGYGFIQGANAAGADLGIAKDEIEVKYMYLGNFDATPENQTKASAWFSEGTEVIFACGGAAGNSVMKAAETAGKKVIGVDVDQSTESNTVITSAMKNLQIAVYNSLKDFFDGNFIGGKSITLTAVEDGVELPLETSKFSVFTKEKYDELYQGLISGEIKVENDTVASEPTGVPADLVTVNYIK